MSKAKANNSGVTVFTETDIINSGNFPSEPFRPKEAIFILVTNGSMQLTCNLEDMNCNKDSLCFFQQNCVYTLESVDENFTCIGLNVSLNYFLSSGVGGAMGQLFQSTLADIKRQYHITRKESNALYTMLSLLKDFFLPDVSLYNYNEIILSQVLAVFFTTAGFFRKYNAVKETRFSRKHELTARFLDLLQSNTKQERSLQFYANKLAVTAGHLAKVIKNVTGKAATELLDAAVIIEAKILLSTPSLSISQIAETMHFSDQSVFGRYFKNQTGITPSAYRNSLRQHKNTLF